MGLVVCGAREGSPCVLGLPGPAVLPGGVWQPRPLHPFPGEAARDSSVTSACLVPSLDAEDAVGLLLALLLVELPG